MARIVKGDTGKTVEVGPDEIAIILHRTDDAKNFESGNRGFYTKIPALSFGGLNITSGQAQLVAGKAKSGSSVATVE